MKRPAHSRREILLQLSEVARTMRTYIDQRAREHGMTRAQWGALVRLQRQEGMTQAELAENLEIQPISLVRLIDRLCLHGLVERRPHPRDRRANRLYLTEKGRTTLLHLAPLGKEIAGQMSWPRWTRPTWLICCRSCCSSAITSAVPPESAASPMAPRTTGSLMSASTFTQLRASAALTVRPRRCARR